MLKSIYLEREKMFPLAKKEDDDRIWILSLKTNLHLVKKIKERMKSI